MNNFLVLCLWLLFCGCCFVVVIIIDDVVVVLVYLILIKNMPLWHYGILLPEEEGDCSLSYLLNLSSDELKSIL